LAIERWDCGGVRGWPGGVGAFAFASPSVEGAEVRRKISPGNLLHAWTGSRLNAEMQDLVQTAPASVRSWAEISRAALRENVQSVQARLPVGVGILAVVKANAYGHGLSCVIPEVAPWVRWFGVACVAEAAQVRSLGMTHPILIMGPVLPAERESVVRGGFVPVVSCFEEARDFEKVAERLGCVSFPVHAAVDTGMGRIGVWEAEALELIQTLRGLRRIRLAGLGTHFPSADEDPGFTESQIERFSLLVDQSGLSGNGAVEVHLANSAGLLRFTAPCATLVRPGLALYGCSPVSGEGEGGGFRGAMTWKTRVILVRNVGPGRSISYGRTFIAPREMQVATLAVGYADGYPRSLSGAGAEVLIRGRRCAVLGRVTMDQVLVDVSGCGAVEAGEEAVLLGCQGNEEVSVRELARKAGTIPWEIFTGVGNRVERVLVE
jgi:alanine racemase